MSTTVHKFDIHTWQITTSTSFCFVSSPTSEQPTHRSHNPETPNSNVRRMRNIEYGSVNIDSISLTLQSQRLTDVKHHWNTLRFICTYVMSWFLISSIPTIYPILPNHIHIIPIDRFQISIIIQNPTLFTHNEQQISFDILTAAGLSMRCIHLDITPPAACCSIPYIT